MAKAAAHAFGQVIGELLEKAMQPSLKAVADEYGMYMDYKHPRPTRMGKGGAEMSLVSWIDSRDNKHDLDFVFEQGGSETVVGRPRAFIEIAWRRYTKHSKNKAQEIEGAIGHLRDKYNDCHPFLGAVLAGEFTKPSLQQLRSHGFTIIYFTYENVIAAFEKLGIDARYNEGTPDEPVFAELEKYRALNDVQRTQIADELVRLHRKDVDDFVASLRVALGRTIEAVSVMPLYGTTSELTDVADAIAFVQGNDENAAGGGLVRYEVTVRYSNGSKIEAGFASKAEAVDFLNRLT